MHCLRTAVKTACPFATTNEDQERDESWFVLFRGNQGPDRTLFKTKSHCFVTQTRFVLHTELSIYFFNRTSDNSTKELFIAQK